VGTGVAVGLAIGLLAGFVGPGLATADIAPQSSTTTAPAGVPTTPAVTPTTLSASAGDTQNGTTGTIVFVIVTAIIVIGGVLIFVRARANRLSSGG
jgi:hypothetical protein